ncbi:hypothetical protein LXL04_017748 [Taraxacum kok-saghyz]
MTKKYLRNPCPLQLPLMSKTLFYTVSACDYRLEQEDDGPSGEIRTTLRVLGIIVAALVLIWNIRYRGGLALISDKKKISSSIVFCTRGNAMRLFHML